MLNIGRRKKLERLSSLVFLFVILLLVVSLSVWAKKAGGENEIIIETPEVIIVAPIVEPTTEEMIIAIAKERGWNDNSIDILVKIAKCESRLDRFAIGVNNNRTVDRGLFQFNSHWRKDISSECAFDISCATNEAINTANKNGDFYAWSCYNKIK